MESRNIAIKFEGSKWNQSAVLFTVSLPHVTSDYVILIHFRRHIMTRRHSPLEQQMTQWQLCRCFRWPIISQKTSQSGALSSCSMMERKMVFMALECKLAYNSPGLTKL